MVSRSGGLCGLTGYNVWNLPRPGIEPMSPAFQVEVNTVLGPILLLRKLGSRDVTYPRLLSRWQKQSLNYLTPKPKFLSKIFHASHHIGLAAQRQKCGGIVELMSVRMNSGPWASFAVNRFADKKPLCG